MEASQPKAPEGWRSPRRYRAIHRFKVPMHAQERKGAFHEPRHPLTPSLSPTGGGGVRRTGEGDSERFMVPMHGNKAVGALHEPQGAAGILPAEESEGKRNFVLLRAGNLL